MRAQRKDPPSYLDILMSLGPRAALTAAKGRLYDNINPVGYHNAGQRLYNAIVKNEPEHGSPATRRASDAQLSEEQRKHKYDSGYNQKERSDLLKALLGLGDEQLEKSPYREGAYRSPKTERRLVEELRGLSEEDRHNKIVSMMKKPAYHGSGAGGNNVLGNFTVNFGEDENGAYIDYYDVWDLNPFSQGIDSALKSYENEPLGKTLGEAEIAVQEALFGTKAPEVYGRVYLDDIPKRDDIPKGEGKVSFTREIRDINTKEFGGALGDPKKNPSSYRDVLLASVDSTKASSIPPQMLDEMQSIVDSGNMMENKDQLKDILGVLVNDYGLDTSKLADGITQYKTDAKDLNWLQQKAERAKLGAGLTALGYANGGLLDTNIGDPKKEKAESTGYAALDARLARLAAEDAASRPDTINYNTSQSDRLQRQMMAESSGNAKAVSPVGAKGLFQIMPGTQTDLEQRGLIPAGLDPFNPEHSRQMRDAKINALSELQWIKNPPQHIPDKNRLARIYASYNWGEGNVRRALEKAKADGVDIYGDPDLWYRYLPAETSGYLNKILD